MKRVYIISLCLLILIMLPTAIWHLQPSKKCSMAIIDKTVPDETHREHNGIVLLLNHLKYTKQSGALYDAREDYFGFSPNEKDKSYALKPLPTNYDDYEVIYLADSYGVYEEDLPWIEKEREGSRSRKVYGGLEEEEWISIVKRLVKKEKSLFIAEYNAFASPTEKEVNENIANYLGVSWSGWTGRYFMGYMQEKFVSSGKNVPVLTALHPRVGKKGILTSL